MSTSSSPGHRPAAHTPPASRSFRRYVPIVGWLPEYERAWFARDAIAGATIWGLLIPAMIAYAGLAGLPPQAGLYTLIASLALYAIFGTSRHLVVAGTSASAVLVFSTVTELKPADPETYMALAAGMIVLTRAGRAVRARAIRAASPRWIGCTGVGNRAERAVRPCVARRVDGR